MSHGHILRRRQGALAIAIHLALLAGAARATDTPDLEQFPAYVDGQLVPARFDDPNGTGRVHHDGALLGVDVATAMKEHCAQYPGLLTCELKSQVPREISGAIGKHSAYSMLDITVIETNSASQTNERVINGDIRLVRSCPTDSILISDDGTYLENRDALSGSLAVACVSPDALPKGASLGMPEESGANQCPIGNSPTVGNPINPLTMTRPE